MKYTLLILLLLIVIILPAENHEGDLLIGGEISYSISKSDKEFTDNGYYGNTKRETGKLFVHPKIGFFVSRSVAIGLGMKCEYTSTDYENSTISTTEGFRSIYSAVPFFTKYFDIKDDFSFSANIELEAGFGKDEFKTEETIETEILKLGISFSPAIVYSISKRWLITLKVGSFYYNWTRETLVGEEDYQNIDQRFGVGLDLESVYLGFQYKLPSSS